MPRQVHLADVTVIVDDDQPTFWDRVHAGNWEQDTLARLAKLCGPGVTFIDLGAWVGPTALYAAAKGADVIAVEADPAALGQLQRNLTVNPRISQRIRVIDRAIAASAAPVKFGARRKPGDSMSSALFASASGTTWTTAAITADNLFDDLPMNHAIVVKLDIEGGEFDILSVLIPALPAQVEALIVSFHPAILKRAKTLDESGLAEAVAAATTALTDWQPYHVGLPDRPIGTDAGVAILEARDKDALDLMFVRR